MNMFVWMSYFWFKIWIGFTIITFQNTSVVNLYPVVKISKRV